MLPPCSPCCPPERPFSRRAVLRLGGLSLFGLSLPRLLEARAAQTPEKRKDVSCILLWMGGGPSNIDTFDMKPEAPVEYRGEFRPIESNVSGVQVCEHLPKMARCMDKVCLIRSLSHPESGDHAAAQHYLLTGYPQRPDPTAQPVNSVIYPSYGSVVGRELGWRNSLPPYVLLGSETPYAGAGYFGAAYDPLRVPGDPNAQNFAVRDVTVADSVGLERTLRRKKMLAAVDAWQKKLDRTSGTLLERQQFYAQAYDLITSPAAKTAFQLEREDPRVRERYGRDTFGQRVLLARRLVEAGVRFVHVETSHWDTHTDNFKSLRDNPIYLPSLDRAWSALLEDLADRGMLANTLVIWMGEFGRTPRINGQAGRDHWAPSNAICLSGAGIRMGTVVGKTDRLCERPVGTTHGTHDLAATIFHILGIDGTKEYRSADGRPLLLNYHGTPIAEALA